MNFDGMVDIRYKEMHLKVDPLDIEKAKIQWKSVSEESWPHTIQSIEDSIEQSYKDIDLVLNNMDDDYKSKFMGNLSTDIILWYAFKLVNTH